MCTIRPNPCGGLATGFWTAELRTIINDRASVDKAFEQALGAPDRLRVRACYEAGFAGHGLARQLQAMGIDCRVVIPKLALEPFAEGSQAGQCDAGRLALMYRAGDLMAIRIPTPAEEAVRELSLTRIELLADLMKARDRLTRFRLRPAGICSAGISPAGISPAGIEVRSAQLDGQFDDPAVELTHACYVAEVDVKKGLLDAVDSALDRLLHQGALRAHRRPSVSRAYPAEVPSRCSARASMTWRSPS